MSLLISIFHVTAAIILIMVVLLQAGKDAGLGALGGGGASDSILGTQSNAFLNKLTTIVAILFMVTSLALAIMSAKANKSIVLKHTSSESSAPKAVEAENLEASSAAEAVAQELKTAAEGLAETQATSAEEQAGSQLPAA